MAEEGTERQRKRVIVLSRGSFWWRAVKDSLKHSRDPFDHFTTYLAIFAGLVVICFTLKWLKQEWVDSIIYYTLAIPSAVWGCALIWNLIKMPHKIYKTDITAVIAGAEVVNDRKTGFGNFARVFLVTIIVGAFMVVFTVKNSQISELQAKLALPKQEAAAKPLPVKNIPDPQLPTPVTNPTPVTTNALAQKAFETNNIDNNDENSAENAVARAIARAEEEKNQKEKDNQEYAQKEWGAGYSDRNYSIESLYRILDREAAKHGDGIVKTIGYFQSVPKAIKADGQETLVAEIGFQIKTNVHFRISVFSTVAPVKALQISCDSGFMYIYSSGGHLESPMRALRIPGLNYDENVAIPPEKSHEIIDNGLRILAGFHIKEAFKNK